MNFHLLGKRVNGGRGRLASCRVPPPLPQTLRLGKRQNEKEMAEEDVDRGWMDGWMDG